MIKFLSVTAIIAFIIFIGVAIRKACIKPIKPKKEFSKNQKLEIKILNGVLIAMGIILLLVVLLIPIGVYVNKFWNNELSDNKGDWGTFGDFVGGLLNPVISVLTLALTAVIAIMLHSRDKKRQDDEAKRNVQPELVTNLQKVFYCNSSDLDGVPYPLSFSYEDYERKTSQPSSYIPFYIPIYNIGHRTAKNISFRFTMDFDRIVALFQGLNNNSTYAGKINLKDSENTQLYGQLQFRLKKHIDDILLIKENISSISHIFNAEISNQPYHLDIPSQFLDLYQAYVFLNYHQEKPHQKFDFPPISLTIDYEDIYGTTYKYELAIRLEYWMGYENTIHQLTAERIN